MNESLAIASDWTRQIGNGIKPSSIALRDHLNTVHNANAGFTEACAWNSRDANGKNSYQLLADIIDLKYHSDVLDLGCGSGVLLELCDQRFETRLKLSGIDMSNAELELARQRLVHTDAKLYQGIAQNIGFIPDSSFDVILCHWALTLMDPVIPALTTIKRILRDNGVFAAIIDGDRETEPTYTEVHNIIYKYVQQEYPDYGMLDLGDPRIRTTNELRDLLIKKFDTADIEITPVLLSLIDKPYILARKASGFFYASFVLSAMAHRDMLFELEDYFAKLPDGENSRFNMPVNKLVIRQN